MFQIRWTRKALFSFADTLNYWNFHNSSQKYSRKLRIEVEKKENLFPKIHTSAPYQKLKKYDMY
jgi:hypothetical protein